MNTGGCSSTPVCPPFWVADATYTAECSGGRTISPYGTAIAGPFGPPVTVTRQFRSTLSLDHARQEALALAKREAEIELVCRFRSTQCVTPQCGSAWSTFNYPQICATADSLISQGDAEYQARQAALVSANEFCAHTAWERQ